MTYELAKDSREDLKKHLKGTSSTQRTKGNYLVFSNSIGHRHILPRFTVIQ